MNKNKYLIIFCLAFLYAIPVQAAEKVNVIVTGVEDALLQNVLSSLSIEQQKEHPRLSKSRVRSLFARGDTEIKKALQALGYYHPIIQSDLRQEAEVWQVSFQVDPGQPITISKVDIQISGAGNSDQAFQNLRENFAIKTGNVLDHGQYESAKNHLMRLAAQRGYFDAVFERSKVEVDLKKNVVEVFLHFNTGDRYTFGEITLQPTVIRDQELRRYLPFKNGDPYHSSSLIKLQRRLSDTDYFSRVSVQPQQDKTINQQVPVDVAFEPKKRSRYTAGFGFGTDTGPRMKLGWLGRYVNSRGHRMSADAKISPVLSKLSTDYTVPYFRGKDAELGFNASLSREDTDTSKSNAISIGASHRTKRWGWDETASVSYLLEDFDVAGTSQTSMLLMPGISWKKTETDNTTYTNNGFRLSVSFRGAVEGVLSDVSFFQTGLSTKYIRTFWESGRVIARGDLGLTEVSDFDKLPTSLRYFTGGDNTIRGFDFEQLGPKDDQGNIIGGKYLAVASLEYEHRILEKWSVATFVDAGNSFNKFGEDIEYGVGVGVRWLSPVGLVRVDLAMGVSEPDKPIRLHIVIGPDL